MTSPSRVRLRPKQREALNKMHDGCVLMGGVGSGKSITAVAYWRRAHPDRALVVVTTPAKRDSMEWEAEIAKMGAYEAPFEVVSWNKISDVKDRTGCFFVFDEQKLRGSGKWAQNFLKISSKNDWIMLSATPGDSWKDYLSLFLANGWYENKTDFYEKHVIWDRWAKYPKIKRYVNEARLRRLRARLLVEMGDDRETERRFVDHWCDYDREFYEKMTKKRWDPYEDAPQRDAAALCRVQQRIVNTSHDRREKARQIVSETPRILVFYSWEYERDILLEIGEELGRTVTERNGHRHDPVPDSDEYLHIVHYSSCEAWNCVSTDTVMFYSPSYSWWMAEQAFGRIDRMNTAYRTLYCHRLLSDSSIGRAIMDCQARKERFNESAWKG